MLLVDAVFVLFLAAQAAAFFGGHDYVQRATGLTYAELRPPGLRPADHRHRADPARGVGRRPQGRATAAADRWWLRGSLGALCLLTLVVVASALHRMDLYQDAYGFTRLRLLVDLFEGWLGLVVVAVLVAGIGLRGWWLPRMALLCGAALLLGLASPTPTRGSPGTTSSATSRPGRSTTPTCAGSASTPRRCWSSWRPRRRPARWATRRRPRDPWVSWNLARVHARDALATFEMPQAAGCDETVPPPE